MKIKFLCLSCLLLLIVLRSSAEGGIDKSGSIDTNEIIRLNKKAFDNRLTNPDETVNQAKKVFVKASKINYINGMAEANRIMGIGYYYVSKADTAIDCYLTAIKLYQSNSNLLGVAKVENNIGNLYFETDYDQALDHFMQALNVAKKVNDESLIATIYINIGNVYCRKKAFHQALDFYDKSILIFTKKKDTVNLIQCLQNKGVAYYNLHELDKALELMLKANGQAKQKDLNNAIAGINLTLTSIYIAKNDFNHASQYLQEGLNYAQIGKSIKREEDYKYTSYQLEMKRGDYKKAVFLLREIYQKDSITFKSNGSTRLTIANEQYKQREIAERNEHTIEMQKYDRKMFWASSMVACLLLVVSILLVNNVNRKTKTNSRLTELNSKISEQKENLNQINHHLEEIIDELTKDLQVKNKKLADYSLHLSHQIRGPIATLKGLLNLEKDKLIEASECIKLMNKCVSEIDDNIIDMSGMLHEPGKG